jgi:hypothetical protein
MEEWEEEGFASEEAHHQSRLAEMEAEQEAEFCMSFVNSGGLASEWRQAYRQSQMTEEELGEYLQAQYGEYGAE